MKIGVLIDRLNVGGVEKIALEQVRALRRRNVDASLVVLSEKGVVENAFPNLQNKVPIVYLDSRLPKILRFSFRFPVFHFFSFFHISYPLLIPFIIKKKEYDYLIVHGTYTAFTAITIKWIKGIPFSTFIWDPISYIVKRVYSNDLSSQIGDVLTYIGGLLDKLILLNTEYILVGGTAHNRILSKLAPKKEIVLLTPGVHPTFKPLLKRRKQALLVTAWKKGKNPEYIFKLIEHIPKLKVIMVGKWVDDEYKKKFLETLANSGYSRNIKVIGEVSEKELQKYYKESLFLLQINDDRGFGMPALEAASQGTTFIIPKGQGVCALFKDKTDGFYVEETNLSKIIKRINLLLNNDQIAIMAGFSAWEKTKNSYSWNNHAKSILQVVFKHYKDAKSI